jgi:hypothetical protein
MKVCFEDDDFESLMMWCEDTLEPSLCLFKVKSMVREFLFDVIEHENKRGKTKKTEQSRNRLNQILEFCERLDRVATQNSSFQFAMRQQEGKLKMANKKIQELESQIIGFEKAWNQE